MKSSKVPIQANNAISPVQGQQGGKDAKAVLEAVWAGMVAGQRLARQGGGLLTN